MKRPKQHRFSLSLGALALTLAGASSSALAGWTSSGGELVRDQTNPWFIQNTPVVKACIAVDPEHFHLANGALDLQHDYVEKALDYWKKQFAEQQDYLGDVVNYPRIDTQKFEFGPCSEATDLRFQFGFLTAAQRQYLQGKGINIKNYVSLAERTSYDQKELRGRGFIYISADSGDLRPDDPAMIAQPWADNRSALVKVLAHELGHVFGLAHTATTGSTDQAAFDLMSAQFPELMVSDDFTNKSAYFEQIPAFFTHDGGKAGPGICVFEPLAKKLTDFLGATTDTRCITFSKRSDEQIDIVVSNGTADDSPSTVVGSVKLDAGYAYSLHTEVPIRLWLPPSQTFVGLPQGHLFQDLAVGSLRKIWQKGGVYHDVHGGHKHRVVFTSSFGAAYYLAGILDSGELMDLLSPLPERSSTPH